MNLDLKTEKILISKSDEVASHSGTKSLRSTATLWTATDWVSPVIDVNRTHAVLVHNIVNADTTGEDGASGGNLINKYVSPIITLDEGQDAEDLHVWITGYKPPSTNIKVWIKYHNAEDSDRFIDRPWLLAEMDSADPVSSVANDNDTYEWKFVIPRELMTGTYGEVQYTNSNGVTFSGYKRFAIKIGLLSSDSAVIPMVMDVRAVALQM